MADNERMSSSARSTLIVSSMTFISRLLGFLRIAVISAVFGAGGVADVINLTFNIPNNLRKLLAEGALSSAFIPILSEAVVNEKSSYKPSRIVQSLMAFQLVILVPLCIIVFFFAEPLIAFLLSEFTEVWQIELSKNLFRWFINYLLLISISAVLIGVLNTHKQFLIPSVTPILFSIFVISSIVLFHKIMGPYSMVLGVLLGGVAQVLFLTPKYLHLGYGFSLNFNFKSQYFKKIIHQWLPVVASSSIFTITQVIALRFASGLEEGSASALSNAIVFWQLPMGIFSASITTVLFPKMSRQAALNDYSGLKDSIQYGVRFLLVFLIPSAVFLILFGDFTIELALQRGKFTAENTIMANSVLSAYSIGLFSVGLFNFIQRFFYSLKDYKSPFYISLFTGILDILLSIILKESSLRISGLAAANSIAFTIGAVLFFIKMKKSINDINCKKIFFTILKVICSVAVGAFSLLMFKILSMNTWVAGSSITKIIIFLSGLILYCAVIVLLYYLLKVEMIRTILRKRKIL